MQKVVIGSQNPVKLKCVEEAFSEVFPHEAFQFEGVNIPSDVADQPMTDYETYRGADNRSSNAQAKSLDGDYWVGIEGGVDYHQGEMEAFAWIVIRSKNRLGKSRTASFFLPPEVKSLVEQGMELGHADDQVFNRNDSKSTNGAVGILTKDRITRATYYKQAVILALIPFIQPTLYQSS